MCTPVNVVTKPAIFDQILLPIHCDSQSVTFSEKKNLTGLHSRHNDIQNKKNIAKRFHGMYWHYSIVKDTSEDLILRLSNIGPQLSVSAQKF